MGRLNHGLMKAGDWEKLNYWNMLNKLRLTRFIKKTAL